MIFVNAFYRSEGMKKIFLALFIYCSLWGATAYLGVKETNESFDRTVVTPKVKFKQLFF